MGVGAGQTDSQELKIRVADLVEAQQQPFILIDKNYTIVAANLRYAQAYGLHDPAQIIGRKCHAVSHRSDRPCHLNGEDCPHQHVFKEESACEVVHRHFDGDNRPEVVTIRGIPVRDAQGTLLYMGESLCCNAKCSDLRGTPAEMVGHSTAFLNSVKALCQVAETDLPVLITGETGTGKELAASLVHRKSTRHNGPFITVDVNVLGEELLASELFGHEKGAFTGAVSSKKGLFDMADGGTLFLDEIGELSPMMQVRLLRVLETGTHRRVGGTELRQSDVRLIFATHRDLRKMVDEGSFRMDLYYRIAKAQVVLAPLRDRRADIPELCDHTLRRQPRYRDMQLPITREALDLLLRYHYPGNVRELINLVERAIINAQGAPIEPVHLPPEVHAVQVGRASPAEREAELLSGSIEEALRRFKGNRRQAAESLGVSERTVYRWLRSSKSMIESA